MKNKGDEKRKSGKEEVRKRGGAMRHGMERINEARDGEDKITGDETKRGEDQRE